MEREGSEQRLTRNEDDEGEGEGLSANGDGCNRTREDIKQEKRRGCAGVLKKKIGLVVEDRTWKHWTRSREEQEAEGMR